MYVCDPENFNFQLILATILKASYLVSFNVVDRDPFTILKNV